MSIGSFQTSRPGNEYGSRVALPTNGWAIASLVCSILGYVGFPLIGALLGIIFGYVALAEITRSGGQQPGRRVALWGIALGWTAVALGLLLCGLLFALRVVVLRHVHPSR